MAKFIPRQRKHKVLSREKSRENGTRPALQDTNKQEILPQEKLVQEEKRARMKNELASEGTKMSSQKAKRLEKYIDNKLKKDENRELLEKLAAKKIDTSLFASSRNLGQRKQTRKQAFRQAIQRRNAGLPIDGLSDSDQESSGSVSRSDDEEHMPSPDPAPGPVFPAPRAPALAGSGLKRPLEVDDDGRPVIQKRQRRGGVKSKIQLIPGPQVQDDSDSSEWEGFGDDVASEFGSGEANEPDESDTSEGGSETEGSEQEEEDTGEPRVSAFKAWAHRQRNQALGYEPASSVSTVPQIPKPQNFKPRPIEQDPLPLELQPTKDDTRKAYSVAVNRTPEIQSARMALPILAEEQQIMEAIHNNDVVVISGATGSGKTTQIPQFLYEAGYGSPASPTPGLIGITQPRRVAAVSMSKRVAQELGDHSHVVAYQIRFEGTADRKTAIKFMTDGVLLREVAEDLPLRKYSAIIVDEAHERSVNTDVLLGILSRVNRIRQELREKDPTLKPLKLIIMSATLRIEDVTQNTKLFPMPPRVIEVEGRQYPVTIHFARRTRHDYVEEAFRKISRGHRKLPPGGFLVFLTGQSEIHQLTKKLKMAFNGFPGISPPKVRIPANEAPFEPEDVDFGDDDGRDDFDEDSGSGEEEEDDEDEFVIENEEPGTGPLRMNILPLYSLLPTKDQQRVFDPPPDGSRQVILATNVAETSLTIPGIRYVFDCGRSKERKYNKLNGVQSFEIDWISKASASQRSGRAGRTGAGHCYRLYSSAVYERDLPEFAEPELLRTPLEGVALRLKAMKVPNVASFPFPTPPEREGLLRAEKILKYLSALSLDGQVTNTGSIMSIFPLSPRFAKILLVGHQFDCLPYTIAMVAGLSAGEVFLPPPHYSWSGAETEDGAGIRTEEVNAEKAQADRLRAYNSVHENFCSLDDRSDAMKILQVVGEFAHEPTEAWCQGHFVSFKALKEVQLLRRQFLDLLKPIDPLFRSFPFQAKMDRPTEQQIKHLKQIVASGFVDQVAIRIDKAPYSPEGLRMPTRAIDVPYLPLIPLEVGNQADKSDRLVYIHPSSPLSRLSTSECPEYIVYAYLQKATPSRAAVEKKPKTRMHALTDVTGRQLASLAKGTPLISYGKPVKEISATAASREFFAVPYLRAEGVGGMGWPLPIKKVKQNKEPGKGWVVV